MSETDWFVKVHGHEGVFRANSASEAKRQLVSKICEDFRKANGYQKTRGERRFLNKWACAWRMPA